MTHRDKACVLCGVESNDVLVRLIAWREPIGQAEYTAAPRCRDEAACRARVEALDDHGPPGVVHQSIVRVVFRRRDRGGIRMTTATETFEAFVARRFKDGKLYKGAHDPNGMACLHEAVNVYRGEKWSDSTEGTIDLRGLNDAPWSSDELRTQHMLPLGALILAWPSWSEERRVAFAKRVAEQTIRQIVPIALRAAGTRLPSHREALEAAAQRCADEGTESAAESAWSAAQSAWSAAQSAAWSAAESAWSAAESAWSAASAAWSAQSAAQSAAWSAAESAQSAAQSAADEPLIAISTILREAFDAA